MKKMKAFYWIPLFSILTCPLASLPAHAEQEAHGGDGITVDGQLIPRDFIARMNPTQIGLPELSFYAPDFEPLITEIGVAYPRLGYALLPINDIQFSLTAESLPAQPKSVVGLDVSDSDSSIAVRYGQDIIISAPEMLKHPEKAAYVLLKLLVQGLAGSNNPLSENSAQAVVQVIRSHRGNLSEAGLDSVLKSVHIEPLASAPAELTPLLRAVFKNDPLAPAILNLIRHSDRFIDVALLEDWTRIRASDSDSAQLLSELQKSSPVLARFIRGPAQSKLPEYTSEAWRRIQRPTGWFVSGEEKAEFKKKCQQYDTPRIATETAQLVKEINQRLSDIQAVKALMQERQYGDNHLEDVHWAIVQFALFHFQDKCDYFGPCEGNFTSPRDMVEVEKRALETRATINSLRDWYEDTHRACQPEN